MDDLTWSRIASAMKRGRDRLTRAELEGLIASGKAQLWLAPDSVMVTQLVATSEGRFLHVWLGAGRLATLLALQPGVEAWGRAQGCQFVSIDGRSGWDRVLKDFTRQRGELRKVL